MMTELVRVEFDEVSARQLTEHIRSRLESVQEQIDQLERLITEARDRNVHVALGYRSWTEYAEREFGDLRLRLRKADRQELVVRLAEMGMSTRAIAPVAGVNQATVTRDLKAGDANASPDEPRSVTGRDGKSYEVPPSESKQEESSPTKPQAKPKGSGGQRTDVCAVMARVLAKSMDAVDTAAQIKPEHLKRRKDEAVRWAHVLNDAIASLQQLVDLLEENS